MSAEPFDDDVEERDRLVGRYVKARQHFDAETKQHDRYLAVLRQREDALAKATDDAIVAVVECEEAERRVFEAAARCAELSGPARIALTQLKAEIEAERAIASFVEQRRAERAA